MYTNHGQIALPIAVWLAADDGYDLIPQPDVVSVTDLLDPLRSLILTKRLREQNLKGSVDLSDMVPSRLGSAVHTAIELAWLHSRDLAFENLGIPKHVSDRIRINADNEDEEDAIYIYIEKRSSKEVDGITVSGKFDFVELARVKDNKTTKTYNWIKGSNNEKYALQGSIYRWLNTDIIRDDFMDVLFMFTDWSPFKALADKKYPQKRVMTKTLPLLSLEKTEQFVTNKVQTIKQNMGLPQDQLPRCTPTELWMDPPKFAFYKDPTKTARATKLFDSQAEAIIHKTNLGGNGLIVERKAEPKFCNYCDARSICKQAAEYINEGILKL